jgi:ABC-2 type transport system ATP-binding protein
MAIAAATVSTSPRTAVPASEPAPPVIRIRGLEKRFATRRSLGQWLRFGQSSAGVRALGGISLDIPRGGFFGLLGPNGAGKTTLFKILATLIRPDAGTVEVDGIDVERDPAAVRAALTPVIADERSLYWRLSGPENLRLYAALYGVPGSRRDVRIRDLLETVGLGDAASRMVGTYSSGMKQRLLIARALLSRPSVLLLDEPTRSLDPVSARDFRRFLREEVAGRQRCTVVLATHDADEAFDLCGRLAVLNRGALVATGTAEALAAAAANERCRITVDVGAAERAVHDLERAGFGAFVSKREPGEAWAVLEGPAAGGVERTAELNALLMRGGISVAGLEPGRLALADLIEGLVSKAPSAAQVPVPLEIER